MGQHFFFHFSSAMVVDDNVKTKWDKGIFYTRVMEKKKKIEFKSRRKLN